MTRYSSRSVIPGRPRGAEGDDIDRLVFGQGQPEAAASPANSNDDIGDDEIVMATPKRRKGRRASDDFRPLPGEGGQRDAPENNRALLILAGVVLVTGIFGWVVWNAYQQGVIPRRLTVDELFDETTASLA